MGKYLVYPNRYEIEKEEIEIFTKTIHKQLRLEHLCMLYAYCFYDNRWSGKEDKIKIDGHIIRLQWGDCDDLAFIDESDNDKVIAIEGHFGEWDYPALEEEIAKEDAKPSLEDLLKQKAKIEEQIKRMEKNK